MRGLCYHLRLLPRAISGSKALLQLGSVSVIMSMVHVITKGHAGRAGLGGMDAGELLPVPRLGGVGLLDYGSK